jgi:hypothetical protein
MDKRYDVMFEGVRVNIPDWTNYLVQETNGSIRALQQKPVLTKHFQVWSVLYGLSEEVHKGGSDNKYEPVCKEIRAI